MEQQPLVGRCAKCGGLLTVATGRALREDQDMWKEMYRGVRDGGMIVESMTIEAVRLLPICNHGAKE